MLLHTIQAASVAARKARDTARATLLVTLFSEAQRAGKDDGNRDSTDEEVLKTVRKFLKGVDEFIGHAQQAGDEAKLTELAVERTILEAFLPQQADEVTLRAAIADLLGQHAALGPKAMGPIMAGLKLKLGGNYDGALAGRLVKAMMAEAA